MKRDSKTVDWVLSRMKGKKWKRKKGRCLVSLASHMDAKPNGGPAEAYPSQCQHEVIACLKKEFNHQISASSVSEILSDYYLFLDQDIPFLPPPSPQCTGL